MSQDALHRGDLGAHSSPRAVNLAADVAAYAANPLFANIDEWVNELYLNIGLDEGEEWFGA